MKRTPILVENGRVHVTVGDAHASAPIEMLEPLIRLLEASVTFVGAEPAASGAAAQKKAATPKADFAAPKAAAAPKRAKAAKAARKTSAPAASDVPKKYQRKSRKPVAPAIIAWMEANPGWKSEGTLLAAVIDNDMTDADPKRALMIALGKARGKTFDTNGRGHWKLAGDDAGPAPRGDATLKSKAAKNKKAASGKKKAAPQKAKAPAAPKKTAAKSKSRGGAKKKGGRKAKAPAKKRLGLALVDWMELNPGWRHVDELLDAVVENEMTDANPSLALRITLGKGVGTGTFVNDGEDWKLAGDPSEKEEAKAVLVKNGKRATGKGKKKKGAKKGSKRWNKADGTAVDRARKNLLGLSKGSD